MSKKLNPIRDAIANAVKNYQSGTAGLVRVYEMTIDAYWKMGDGGDSKNPENLRYFVNSLQDHPRVQQALVRIMNKHAKFKITSTGSPVERNYQITELKNVKLDESKGETRENYLAEIHVFKASALTSLLNEEGEIANDFKFESAKEGFKKKAFNFVAELKYKHERDEEAKQAIDPSHEPQPFDLAAQFLILSQIIEDAKQDTDGLEAAVEKISESKAKAILKKSEKEAKIRQARMEIMSQVA